MLPPQSRVAAFQTCNKMDNLDQSKGWNFQRIQKLNKTAYFFYADIFADFTYLNTMVWHENTFNCQQNTRKDRNSFYLAKLTPLFINICLEMLGMIWDVLYSMHLYDTYDKYYISFSFHFWVVWCFMVMINIVKIKLIKVTKYCLLNRFF